MNVRSPHILVLLTMLPACGSWRVAGYLEELEDGLSSSGETTGAETAGSSASSEDTGSSGDSVETASEGSESAGTSTSTTGGLTGTTSTSEGSTGEPMALCGNGMLEAFGAVPEECDDGNLEPEDGCDDTCALDRRVFVTSTKYNAGELQSLYIADALCANRADDQGLPDALSFRAWLSDSTTDARDRFMPGRGRLVMVNGLILAASWSALLAGELQNPFEVTETSQTYHGPVWTGTQTDGTLVPGAENCDDWSSDWFQKTAYYGYSDRVTSEWTLSEAGDNPIFCNSSNALYCLQSM